MLYLSQLTCCKGKKFHLHLNKLKVSIQLVVVVDSSLMSHRSYEVPRGFFLMQLLQLNLDNVSG